MFTIQVDASAVLNKIASLTPQVKAQLNQAVETVAVATRDKVVEYAGAGHPDHPNTVTGQLRSSTVYEMTGDSQATVSTTSPYAVYVEYGHAQTPGRFVPALGKRLVASFVPPYPFFRPAIDDMNNGLAIQIFLQVMQEVFK